MEILLNRKIFILLCFIFLCWASFAQEIPVEGINALRNAPENRLVGVGFAQTDNDWESFLLAENRARLDAARSAPYNESAETSNYQESISDIYTHADLWVANIIVLTKTSDGTWWCVIEAIKDTHIFLWPQNDSYESFFSYSMYSPEISSLRTVSSAYEWINDHLKTRPEGTVYGIGAAKIDNGASFFREALYRAKQSLAYSLHSEVTSSVNYYDIQKNMKPIGFPLFEANTVVKGKYQHQDVPIHFIDFVKTSDNTLWVILGCDINIFEWRIE